MVTQIFINDSFAPLQPIVPDTINSFGCDGSPYVTPDDAYLIFSSSRHPEKAKEHEYFNLFYTQFDPEKFKGLAVKN